MITKARRSARAANGLCTHCDTPIKPGRTMCVTHLNSKNARRLQLKIDAINHYGGKCVCPKCAIADVRFLTIDHINNDGNLHRKHIGNKIVFYQWLKNNKYPEGFQVMCFNCNCGRNINGGICPHTEDTLSLRIGFRVSP